MPGRFVWMAGGLLLCLIWFFGTRVSAQDTHVAMASHSTDVDKPSTNVGSETCAVCHADLSSQFSSNPHSRLSLTHAGKGVACESCHGPGSAHVESGGDVTKILRLSKMSTKQVDATCLGCHANAHPNFLRSDHAKAGVGCESCHSVHGLASTVLPASVSAKPASSNASIAVATTSRASTSAKSKGRADSASPSTSTSQKAQLSARFLDALKPDATASDPLQWSSPSIGKPGQNPNLLRASQPQLCFSCHSDVKPAFAQPFHHRVNEGLMKCTDCHDSHGTFGINQLRTTADKNMICTNCHTETRGPFVFEHAAVKSEGCLGCHSPHGSQNARLLNVPNINQMCNQCHSPVAAGTIHGMGAGSAEVQSCISCHTMIHGSNVNPAFIR